MPQDTRPDPVLADFMDHAQRIVETPPPYPAIWVLIAVMEDLLKMRTWADGLNREEKGSLEESAS